jgi:hypothetical protein
MAPKKAITPDGTAAPVERAPRSYISQNDVPRHTIADALRVARALADEYGKQPTRPLQVAAAMGMKPTTGKFQTLTGASIAYGFTEGGSKADAISLTALGLRVVAPRVENDDVAAQREALLKPRVNNEFLTKYDGSKLPREDIGRNVLEGMGVPADLTEKVQNLISAEADRLGLLTDIKGDKFVNLQGALPAPGGTEAELAYDAEDEPEDELVVPEATVPSGNGAGDTANGGTSNGGGVGAARPNAIFLGHGKNKKPLEQLQKTLGQLGIPYKAAIDEPNSGRPISQKVKDTMHQCGAAILIFTADEEFRDTDGNPVWRSSENVIHELGASGLLYDDRIIIFKEESVTLASNFSGIGYISFEKDQLDAKVNDLLRELIAFKILKVSVGG